MTASVTVAAALRTAALRLAASPTPRLDADLLLCHVLQKGRTVLRARPEQPLTPAQAGAFNALVDRRGAGEPVAYLIGRREFWSLPLRVTAATLIPRPETELLVEQALARIPPDAAARVADLGTGSGAIALAIARERPRCRVIATDISPPALAVAADNARALGIVNVEFCHGDWCAALAGEHLDLIASNPPYLRRGDPHLSGDGLPFEPEAALVAGATGLEALDALIAQARQHLAPGGWLLLEHGHDQQEAVRSRLQRHGYEEAQGWCDLSGTPRLAAGRVAR